MNSATRNFARGRTLRERGAASNSGAPETGVKAAKNRPGIPPHVSAGRGQF